MPLLETGKSYRRFGLCRFGLGSSTWKIITSSIVDLPEANMFHRTSTVFTAIALSAISSVALAHTYERCDEDGDHCVRVNCDNDGDRCWRESEYSRNSIYSGPGRWVCDADGDRCHFQYSGRKEHSHREHHDDDDRDR
jgi:hypothetical protein